MTERLECHLTVAQTGATPVGLLATETDLSKQRIKHAMQCGAVWLSRGKHTNRIRRATRALQAGDELHLYYNEFVLGMRPEPATLIDDQQKYSVWDKPPGMLSQGSKWGDHCTITRLAEKTLGRDTFVVHRLDRAASGLILIAHDREAAAQLSTLFHDRSIEKRYRVVVRGIFPREVLPIRLDEPLDGKAAVSDIVKAVHDGEDSVLEVSIQTGRKHQIRRHLASAGYPVIGDKLYGSDATGQLELRAVRISFDCPFLQAPMDYQLAIV